MAKACQIWKQIKKIGNEDLAFKLKVGERITPNCLLKDNSITNGAICFGKDVNGDLYVGQYYQKFLRVNTNLAISGTLPIEVENPTDIVEGISYVRNFAFTTDYLAVVSQIRHLVRIYDRNNNYSLVAQIGEYATSGDVADGRLNDPRDVVFLPNNNLLVVSNNGNVSGHCTEYDVSGNLVATRLENTGDGYAALGTSLIRNPRKAVLDPTDSNYIWIGEAQGKIVKVNLTTWLIEDTIYPLCDFDLSSLESFCFTSNGNIAIASVDFGGVVIIDPVSKEVVDTIDPTLFGATKDIRDVIELEPNFFAITTWTNRNFSRGAYIVSSLKTIAITYSDLEITEDYKISCENIPNYYNQTTNKFDYPINHLEDINDSVAIPLELICQ